MRYTVWCRGRLIGDTDLGFVRGVRQCRSGWFYPNIEGERVLPMITCPLPAMRAYLHRDGDDVTGDPLMIPGIDGSTELADLAEAFQHLSAFALELRREDGSVVPTSDIGIQDTEVLLGLAREAEEEMQAAGWSPEADLDEDALAGDELLEDELAGDAAYIELFGDTERQRSVVEDVTLERTPDDAAETRFPRYQIHVLLLESDAIP
jgi:hypothetical protein